jgi:glutamine amidotransferase-like uncharacterized protein
VIFKGPSICDGCETPFVTMLQNKGYDVHLVMPGESTPELLKNAAVYIVPGGDDITTMAQGWTALDRQAIRDYVKNGGRYYGACLGGYWAGKAGTWINTIPGFEALELIPATVVEASVFDTRPQIVNIHWEGKPRKAYFQDGPSFVITDPSRVLKIYATYDFNGQVSTFLSKYGAGKVGISGVHIEATPDWYQEDHLVAPVGLNVDLMNEIMSDLFR